MGAVGTRESSAEGLRQVQVALLESGTEEAMTDRMYGAAIDEGERLSNGVKLFSFYYLCQKCGKEYKERIAEIDLHKIPEPAMRLCPRCVEY